MNDVAVQTELSLATMSKDEKSLLLFLGTCVVDHGGRVDSRRMNSEDFAIVEQWDEIGFVCYGRVCSADIQASGSKTGSNWCQLSEKAWALAHEERKARAERIWSKRVWRTTKEHSAAS